MPVVLLITIVIVLAVAVLVGKGRGGELPAERTDHAPLDLGPVSATDVVLLRPPTALWGYNIQATDEAMEQIAESIRERDVRIVALEQLVTDLSREHPQSPLPSPYVGVRRRRLPEPGALTPGALTPGELTRGELTIERPDAPDAPAASGDPSTPGVPGIPGTPGAPGTPGPPPERSHD